MPDPKSQPQSKNQAFVVAGQLRDLWNKQPKGRRTLAVLIVLGVVAVVGITSLTKHVETWSSAADGISPDEAQQLYSTLVSRGISARFHEGKVEVHDDDVDQSHAIAATTGLMAAGKGYETFENNTLGQSSFAEQVNYRRALQSELARSIMSIAQIESARVNVAFGRHSVFKEQETAPTASVALHLRAGQSLAGDEVKGIRQLVASSVDGMKPEDVVVIDSHGHPLDASEKTSASDGASMEKAIADQVRKLLETVVGKNHVQVVASVDLDARKIVQTEDLYDKDSAAIRSQARTIDGNDPTATAAGSASGIAGVRGNLPGATPASMTAGAGSNNGKLQETTNFEISHTQRHTENPEVTIKKIHLAVLVDQDKGKDGKMIARSKEQMAQLLALARSAAGVDDARGDTVEIQAASFAPEEDAIAEPEAPKSALPFPLPVMVGAGAGALVLLVVIALVLRMVFKKKSKSTAMVKSPQIAFPTQVAELERVLDARPPNNELPAERELPALNPGKSVQERVMDAVRGDVERAAGVLTAWLNEAPPKGAK
jgi:flagellar M-ring protein FliF